MATIRIKNISGNDRDVPLPEGGAVTVQANHSHEFETNHAQSLLEQNEVWAKYVSDKKPSTTKRSRTRKVKDTPATTDPVVPENAPPADDDKDGEA